MPTAAELIAQLNELPAEEHAAAITTLYNDQGPIATKVRARAVSDGYNKAKKGGDETAAKLTAAEERVAALEEELADVKAKTPDAKAIEDRVTAKFAPKLKAAEEARDAALGEVRTAKRKDVLAAFKAELTREHDDGTRVDPEWADDVAETRWGSRIALADDGSVRVLHLDGDTTYDAADAREAAKLLATDARKVVPARYVISNADPTGGGARPAAPLGTTVRTTRVAPADAVLESKRRSGAYSL